MDHKTVRHNRMLKYLEKLRINELQDIRLAKVLYLPSYYAMEKSQKVILKSVAKVILQGIGNMDFDVKHQDILCLVTEYNRIDHDAYYQSIRELFPQRDTICWNSSKKSKKNRICNIIPKGIWYRWRTYRRITNLCRGMDEDKNVIRYISAAIMQCIIIKQQIEKYHLTPKVVISFFDADLFENLLIQIFQNKKIPCVTNQHGQPVFLSYDTDHLNQSQILNFISDYYLAKGEFTKKQFMNAGFRAEQIKVVGSMTRLENAHYVPNNTGLFAVFLDCPLFEFASKTNKMMIEFAEQIAEKLGFAYLIKMHPLDSHDNYLNLELKHCRHICATSETLQSVFSEIEFGIMGASAIYLDLLQNYIKPFQLVSEISDYPLVEDKADKFQSVEEFMNAYSQWKALDDKEREKKLKKTICRYISDYDCKHKIIEFVESLKG